ncbi:MAG: N-methyl-L-tryptophan oxidase [Phycisphaerae bacterium]
MNTFDCIVLGLGAMGSAACWAMARRGASVLGIEQFGIAHNRGSSHGETRIIRRSYFEHPDYVPLLDRSYELWRELEAMTGAQLFTRTGLLVVDAPDGEVIVGIRRAAEQHNLTLQSLSAADARREFPAFAIPEGLVASFEQDAGYLSVESCVRAMAQRAAVLGCQIHTDERVTGWSSDGRIACVTTDRATYEARRLIITAGPWAAQVLSDLGLGLRVLRKVQLWLGTSDDRTHLQSGFPVFCFVTNGFYYGFPSLDGQSMKIAEHSGEELVASPESLDRGFHPRDAERVQEFAQRHIRGVTTEVQRYSVCMYTMSSDGHFIIDRHPQFENVAIAAGFSGHGFKFAPLIGEVLADLASDGHTRHPVGFLSLAARVQTT